MSELPHGRRLASDAGERRMWAAVVHQAIVDLKTAPLNSLVFSQAASFFTGPGDWAEKRREIGDQIDLHADDLRRLGDRLIATRRTAAGLPALSAPLPAVRAFLPAPRPLPRLVVTPAPVAPVKRGRPVQGGRRHQFFRVPD